jgi:hypothetical protein
MVNEPIKTCVCRCYGAHVEFIFLRRSTNFLDCEIRISFDSNLVTSFQSLIFPMNRNDVDRLVKLIETVFINPTECRNVYTTHDYGCEIKFQDVDIFKGDQELGEATIECMLPVERVDGVGTVFAGCKSRVALSELHSFANSLQSISVNLLTP